MIRLIRPHSFELALQNQYSQPAGAERHGPMRDVERRFALPWFIYSLNSLASSSYQIGSREDADTADRFFQLSYVEPRHALAHSAQQIRGDRPHAARHSISRQNFLAVRSINRCHIADLR